MLHLQEHKLLNRGPPASSSPSSKQDEKQKPVARQRAPRISSEKIMVFALDASGGLLHWLLISDPRILRAEFPDAQGRLSGQVLRHRNPEFLVQLPYDPRTAELRFYHPYWTGKAYVLKLLATVSPR